MYFTSICGHVLDNIAFPNPIAYHVVSDANRERLESLAHAECASRGVIKGWPEIWEETAVEAWKCPNCDRVYVNPTGPRDKVIVYRQERVGMPDAPSEAD